MYKRKLFLFVVTLIVLPVLAGCFNRPYHSDPKSEKGVTDLTEIQFETDVIQLDGEWEFYWKQLLEPGELETGLITGYIDIPSSWNKCLSTERYHSGEGYATYRLMFITGENRRLALKIPRLHTAYKLWVNGELTASAGDVGKSRDTMVPRYLPQIAFFEAQQGENEIVIQVSNFYHRSGGILENIKIGSENLILDLRYKGIANALLLFGALIFIGAYHLALFFFRRKNDSPLYFGLFCILVGIRTLLVGECVFIYLFPGFHWEIAHKIQTLTFYLGVPFILMFFLSVFPKYFHAPVIRIAQLMGAAFGILILLTPVRIFSLVNPIYQIWTVLIIIYVLGVLVKISIYKERGSLLITIGALALLLTSLNDIIFLSIWLNDTGSSFLKTIFRTGNLSSAGQIIFAFTNSLLLAKRFSNSLEHEEVMIAELTEINTNLDDLVFQRTKALADSNQEIERQKLQLEKVNRDLRQLSLKDPLTGVWNRRKYDETIDSEWRRCLRYQRPVSLILLDIDYFKQFNDAYGHMAGDECLTKVGKTIKDSLSRSTDMVARYGGEEFIVLLTDMSQEDVIKLANLLWQKTRALNIPHEDSSVSKYVTVSIGVTSKVPDTHSSYEDLFMVADKALYHAKSNGRNQVIFLSE